MKHLIFFNQFHNGDCFVGREYVAKMTQLLPDGVKVSYAHNNNPAILEDIYQKYDIEHLGLNNIPPMDRMTKVAMSEDKETVYVNTWVGCWQGELFPFGEHINFTRLHEIWRQYFTYFNLPFNEDKDEYLPDVDLSCINTKLVDVFVVDTLPLDISYEQPVVLFCNGPANSGQSGVGDFKYSIERLVKAYPKLIFIATHKLDVISDNLYYTDDIFKDVESDLLLITYLSQFAMLIVGKNSGPFSFCQNQANLYNRDMTFFNFSKLPTDCPTGGSMDRARCLYSPVTEDNRFHILLTTVIEELYDSINGFNKNPRRGTELLV